MALWMSPVGSFGPDVLPVNRWDGIVRHVLRDDPLDNTRLGPCMVPEPAVVACHSPRSAP